MGNHEYCINCGESNFHYGRPCDPIKVAERIKKEQIYEQQRVTCLKRMQEALEKAGIKYKLEPSPYDGKPTKAIIYCFDFK